MLSSPPPSSLHPSISPPSPPAPPLSSLSTCTSLSFYFPFKVLCFMSFIVHILCMSSVLILLYYLYTRIVIVMCTAIPFDWFYFRYLRMLLSIFFYTLMMKGIVKSSHLVISAQSLRRDLNLGPSGAIMKPSSAMTLNISARYAIIAQNIWRTWRLIILWG